MAFDYRYSKKDKVMKVNSEITRSLAETGNIINTINGGTIFPLFDSTKEEDHYRLEVSVPSVNPDDIKVEISGGDLLVYQKVHQNEVTLPNLLGIINISAEVDMEGISAEFEDDILVVIMPFSEMTGGFDREIKIHRPI